MPKGDVVLSREEVDTIKSLLSWIRDDSPKWVDVQSERIIASIRSKLSAAEASEKVCEEEHPSGAATLCVECEGSGWIVDSDKAETLNGNVSAYPPENKCPACSGTGKAKP